MSKKGQILRGEKWFYLMSEESIAKSKGCIKEDVESYLESREKVKSKGKK